MLLSVDFLDDSLVMFSGYYGTVQPSKAKSANLRMDIFAIVELVTQFYPVEMDEEPTLKQIWYLLLIAAISGARDGDLREVTKRESSEPLSPFLGLERRRAEFADYKLAIQVLYSKFESEATSFDAMVEFIRKNYNAIPQHED